VARVICAIFAVVGILPASIALVVQTKWARSIATRETRAAIVSGLGIDANYELFVDLWPLAVSLRNLRVASTDDGGPFLTARHVTVRPKLFGLLSGKITIDQIEMEEPRVRVVMRNGKLQNLTLNLPESKGTGPMKRPPISVVSASDADVDIDIDGVHAHAKEIDADVTIDDDGHGAAAFEVAVRVAEARSDVVRMLEPKEGKFAVDEDVFCRIDGRARIEPSRIVVRRLSAHGAVDLDSAQGTSLNCNLDRDDKRNFDLSLGHLTVAMPSSKGDIPYLDGHAMVRAPLALLDRFAGAPEVDGWVSVDADLHYAPGAPIPDVIGHLEAEGISIGRYHFARTIKSDFSVKQGVVTSALTRIQIADGVADIRDIEVRPLAKGIPLKANIDVRDVNFTSLMRDLGVSQSPHVTWDLKEVHATGIHGTLDNLKLDGDFVAHTTNFAVYDAPVDDKNRTRAIGVGDNTIKGKIALRPQAIDFQNCTVTTARGVVSGVLVSLGFHEVLRVEVADAKINLGDISPIGSVAMGGIAQAKGTVTGPFGDLRIAGDFSVQNYTLGDKPNEIAFGNITEAHVLVEHLDKEVVSFTDVHAQKGSSTYEMPTGRLDFGTAATMVLDAQVTSSNLDVRDFLSVFKFDDDPRFADLGGVLGTSARVHVALGGPDDACKGGYVDVSATTTGRDLLLNGEKFDEGVADFDYRWSDRQAGIYGADIDVRSLSLSKVKKQGRVAIGSVLGSVFIHRGGNMRGSFVLQGLPLARADLLGPSAAGLEGSASGVARLTGTVDAFAVDADVNLTPLRIRGAPFGGSDLHVAFTHKPEPPKIVGKTACGGPVTAPFDKEAYMYDTSVQGAIAVSGALFGGQVNLDGLTMTRQKAPVIAGRVEMVRFDLGPVGRAFATVANVATDQSDEPGAAESPFGGEVSGDLVLERIATSDLAHAKAVFTPKEIRVTRGGEQLELRSQLGALSLTGDVLTVPALTFEITAPNGLKGAFSINGAVKQVTRGAELSLDAELSPIDLGVLVGVVPRLSRAQGTLSGKVRLGGKAMSPQFDGQLKVRAGEFAIKGLPGGITEVDVDAVVDENEARVTRAKGKMLGGDVSATARMPIHEGALGVAVANVTARNLYFTPVEGVRATLDANLEVTENPRATTAVGRLPFVGGYVDIKSFDANKPFSLNLTDLRGRTKRTVVESYDPSLDVVAFGFDVRASSPLRIRNNLVETQLRIDSHGIHVSGTNQRIGLRGELSALPGGHFRVFANDFDIRTAQIRFDDPTRIVPHVDVVAVTDYRRYSTLATGGSAAGGASGAAAGVGTLSSGGSGGNLWRITLHAYGDLEELSIDMTSDPALSREDIFFLLTIGLTRAEVDQVRAGSVYASAAFEAIGTVSGVDRAVKQVIPVIDDFRTGTAYSPITGRVEPNITVGRRLTENVRARITSGLSEDPQLRSSIEWRLNRSFTVEPSYDRMNTTSFSNVGNFGVDLRWRFEFN